MHPKDRSPSHPLFYLRIDTPDPIGVLPFPPLSTAQSMNEERREVRLRHHGDNPIVRDLDALQDQPRQIIPLL